MHKKIIILVLSISLIFTISFLYFTNENKTVNTSKHMESIDTQLRNNVIEIETSMALTHVMKMSYDELMNKTEPYIHSHYRETYFNELKRAYETRNLVPYISEPPYYLYISKVYTNDDNSVRQIFTKSSEISAINLSTKMPVEGTKSQIAKLYTFKKVNEQWKIFLVTNYSIAIDRNEPKKIIEKFTNYNNTPIEYESIKILE